jgi:hypothetical protein
MEQYPFKKSHDAQAAAFFCLDPRFWKQTVTFIQEELGIETFDPYAVPGGARVLVQEATRDIFLGYIEKVSIGLHHVGEIVLVAHRDCGSYGGSSAFLGTSEEKATQVEDLKLARGILNEKFPDLKITMYYLEINGENVEFHLVR